MKKIKLIYYFTMSGLVASGAAIIAASCSKNEETKKASNNSNNSTETNQNDNTNNNSSLQRNIDLDFSKYGIPKIEGQVKERVLLYPAQTRSNNLDKDGVFTMSLHLAPVKGVSGEWIAFATEVKSETDNTLVEPLVIKKASTKAIEDPNADYKLIWKFNEEKLENGKSYTLIFWKKDGTEKIIFNPEHTKTNKDIFLAKLPK